MSISRRQLESFGEPLGDSATYRRAGDSKVVCGGGGGGGQTSTQTISPELRPLAEAYTQRALQLGEQQFTPYTGQRFAEFNPMQSQALESIQQRAQAGNPLQQSAETALQQSIQGGNTNPFLDAMVNRAQQNVLGQSRSAMIGSGSFGNSGIQEVTERNLGDVATQMYGQAYDQDRARQMQAIGMAPQLRQAGYQDATQLLNAGQIAQNQAQQQQDFNYQQFQEKQNLPYRQLAAMGAPFSSGLGQVQTTTGGGK
jgi:hypothetical protein